MATIRQLNRAKIIGKNRTVKDEMLAAGYALSTATKQPPSVTKAKAWKELVEEHMPESKVAQRHGEALDAMKWNDFTGEREPDHTQRLNAVKLNYQITGKLRENVNNFVAGGDMNLEFTKNENK